MEDNENNAIYGLGYIEDSIDPNTKTTESIYKSKRLIAGVSKPALPKSLDYRSQLPKVINQGPRGTCVACSASMMKAWEERKDCGFKGHFSPNFVYFYRKAPQGYGMHLYDAMNILKEKGCCTEKSFPYTPRHEPVTVTNKAIKEAKNYRISSYALIKTVEGVKEALVNDGPCIISFPVYNSGERMWKQKEGDNFKGGHAVTIVGYNDKGFILRNSWGEGWGDKGHCIFPYKDFGMHYHIFTSVDMKNSPYPEGEKKKDDKKKDDKKKDDKKKDDKKKDDKKKDSGNCFSSITKFPKKIIKKIF